MRNEHAVFPLISLILVVRNEVTSLAEVLLSFVAQDYPNDCKEIIVVDGLSDDGTREKTDELLKKLHTEGYQCSLIDNPDQILASGWNIAIHAAKGEFVCRIDAHSSIAPDYVSRAIALLQDHQYENAVAVGGVIVENTASTSFGRLTADLYGSKFGVGNSPFRIPPKTIVEADTTVFGVYRRKVILEYGFNLALKRNQDIDLHKRLRRDGWKLIVNPDMHVKYETRGTFYKLLQKGYHDGFWIPFSGGSLRHKIPMLFVLYLVLLLFSLFVPSTLFRYFALFPLLTYLVPAVFFAIRDGTTCMSKLLLPFVFFSFHFSYGLGTWIGYFNKMSSGRVPLK